MLPTVANRPDSSQPARVHSKQNLRRAAPLTNAKTISKEKKDGKGKEKERSESKTVYKPVFTNPFDLKWPVIPMETQRAILNIALKHTGNRAEFSRQKAKNKNNISNEPKPVAPAPCPDDFQWPKGCIAGTNAVSELLEKQIRSMNDRTYQSPNSEEEEDDILKSRPSFVLVCLEDISPLQLVQHILHLVAALNANRNPQHTEHHCKIVPVPKGSETTLAEALGLKRAAVVSFGVAAHESMLEKDPILTQLLATVPAVISPYLIGYHAFGRQYLAKADSKAVNFASARSLPATSKHLTPTHVKHVRTTAPKDIRASKLARSKAKAAARAKRKGGKGR